MTTIHATRSVSRTDVDARVRDVLARHLHPEHGSEYWLRRQDRLGWDVCDRVRTLDDLWLLGPCPVDELRRFSVEAFIPRGMRHGRSRFVLGETAGTSGGPCVTAYHDDEFQEAFVDPFLRVAEATRFPRGEPWLWVGPSGPHIIGKVVRELARQTGSMDPFSVDFDPRWAKKLVQGSFGRQRYLAHIVDQVVEVMEREAIGVLFITPPALSALTERLSDTQREAIHGIHYGGMSLSPESIAGFQQAYPNAVHLAGYGNTLFGVVMEVEEGCRTSLDYFPLGDRVQFHVVRSTEESPVWPPPLCEIGEVGRVLFHRLDASCLLVGVLERDQAERIAPSAAARKLGGRADGLRNPQPPPALAGSLRLGIY